MSEPVSPSPAVDQQHADTDDAVDSADQEPVVDDLLVDDLLVEDLLVEEVSIDGMCGVY